MCSVHNDGRQRPSVERRGKRDSGQVFDMEALCFPRRTGPFEKHLPVRTGVRLSLSVLQENGEKGKDARTAKATPFKSHSTQNIRTSLKRPSLESLQEEEEEDGEDLISMLNFDFSYGCLDPMGDDKIEVGGFLKTDDDDDLDFII